MLDVIISRGLPLDRITTTDVWATDTIRAELPDVIAAKEQIEEWIWTRYRFEVDHLCARNKDGTKRTYEQMFYHIPQRRLQNVQVERETGPVPARSEASRICGTNGASQISSEVPAYRKQGSITGFPPNTRYNYCQKLKILCRDDQRVSPCPKRKRGKVVPGSQAPGKTPLFSRPCHEGQEKKYRGIPGNRSGRAESVWTA